MKWKKYLFFCSAAMLIGLLSTGCSDALDGSSPDAPGVSLRLVAGQAPSTRAGTDIQSKAFDAGETVNVYITAKKTSADDIIVGAGSFVRKSISEKGIYSGNPAVLKIKAKV